MTAATWIDELAKRLRRIDNYDSELVRLNEGLERLSYRMDALESKMTERGDKGATDSQLQYIADLRASKGMQPLGEDKTRSLTKAEADAMIKALRGHV